MFRSTTLSRLRSIGPTALLLAACHQGGAPRTAARPVAPDTIQVGYGTQARRDVNGAISTVNSDVVRQGTITSFAEMLEGRVPGLEVRQAANGSISVRIRGQKSLLASGEPLFVIDGIPMQDGSALISDLDPRDVQRIEVLKDAGSLAAYGSRGANGVILVTLKRAQKPQ